MSRTEPTREIFQNNDFLTVVCANMVSFLTGTQQFFGPLAICYIICASAPAGSHVCLVQQKQKIIWVNVKITSSNLMFWNIKYQYDNTKEKEKEKKKFNILAIYTWDAGSFRDQQVFFFFSKQRPTNLVNVLAISGLHTAYAICSHEINTIHTQKVALVISIK